MDKYTSLKEALNENQNDFSEMIEEAFDENVLFEMASISKKKTKLPVKIWVQSEITMRHNTPRIKFLNSTADKTIASLLVPLSISDNPQILSKNTKLKITSDQFEAIRQWVIRNKDLLLMLWKDGIETDDFIEQMK